MDEEAIPERDPTYRLPSDSDDTVRPTTWTPEDTRTWRVMVAVRPLLASLS